MSDQPADTVTLRDALARYGLPPAASLGDLVRHLEANRDLTHALDARSVELLQAQVRALEAALLAHRPRRDVAGEETDEEWLGRTLATDQPSLDAAASVHDEPDFARVYDEDGTLTLRRGDVRALLDVATGSLDFGSGMLDEEQVEVLRHVAVRLGVDPADVTPTNQARRYVCEPRGWHDWRPATWFTLGGVPVGWICRTCRSTSTLPEPPRGT